MEPVALDDIKRHLVLDQDDTSEDAYLTSMLMAARRACELRTRRTIVGEDRVLTLPSFPARQAILLYALSGGPLEAPIEGQSEIALEGGSVTAVAVRYYDGDGVDQVLDTSKYVAGIAQVPALLQPVTDWPVTQDRPDAVRIAYTLSPMDGADLDMVRHAIRMIVGHWYANREAVIEMRGGPIELPISVSWLLNPLVQFSTS